jgi:hypothetical protein
MIRMFFKVVSLRCKDERTLQIWSKWLYTLKAILILFREVFTPPTECPDGINIAEHIEIGVTDSGVQYVPSEPTVHWGYVLYVGRGTFKNWWLDYNGVSD